MEKKISTNFIPTHFSSTKKSASELSVVEIIHELKNQIQIMSFGMHLIKQPENSEKWNTVLNNSVENMITIVNDILDSTKMYHECTIDLLEFNLENVVSNIVTIYKKHAESYGLTLSYTICDNVKITLFSDAIRIQQILSNLVTNAIKYSIKQHIVIEVYSRDKFVIFNIKNEGEEKNKLNEIIDINLSRRKDSYKLGLLVSQKIASLLDGFILMEKKDHESEFSFYCPVMNPV